MFFFSHPLVLTTLNTIFSMVCSVVNNGSPSENDSRKRSKCLHFSRTFMVQIRFAAKIPLRTIALALKGNVSDATQDALRVLDIILRQNASKRYIKYQCLVNSTWHCSFCKCFGHCLELVVLIKLLLVEHRGCLLVRQSFFHDDSRNFIEVGGGVTGCRGFHTSFRTTHGGLSLNMGMPSFIIFYTLQLCYVLSIFFFFKILTMYLI